MARNFIERIILQYYNMRVLFIAISIMVAKHGVTIIIICEIKNCKFFRRAWSIMTLLVGPLVLL